MLNDTLSYPLIQLHHLKSPWHTNIPPWSHQIQIPQVPSPHPLSLSAHIQIPLFHSSDIKFHWKKNKKRNHFRIICVHPVIVIHLYIFYCLSMKYLICLKIHSYNFMVWRLIIYIMIFVRLALWCSYKG